MNQVMTVNFHGADLTGFQIGNGIYVALKPIVEAMGLVWNGQLERLKRSEALSEGMRVIRIPSAGGLQETVSLDLSLIHGWLLTIETQRIKDQAVHDRVLLYQRECYKVLWRHFSGQRDLRPAKMDERTKVLMVREARLTFGRPSAAQLWYELEMPRVPGMATAFAQLELFNRNKDQAA